MVDNIIITIKQHFYTQVLFTRIIQVLCQSHKFVLHNIYHIIHCKHETLKRINKTSIMFLRGLF